MVEFYRKRTITTVVKELKSLNTKVSINLNATCDKIICSCPARRLILPSDFYVTADGSLCNFGNTESKNFFFIPVETSKIGLNQKPKLRFLDKVKLGFFKPKMKAPVVNAVDHVM